MRTFMTVLLVVVMAAPAWALTNRQVNNFVTSTPEVLALAKQMETEGKNKILDARVREAHDNSSFSPYVTAMKTLKKEFPDDHEKMKAIVARYDFPSAEDWAIVGDKTIQAFIALQMGDNVQAHITAAEAQLNSPNAENLRKEERVEMEQAITMLKHIGTVPKADQAAVAPYAEQISTFMRDQADQR